MKSKAERRGFSPLRYPGGKQVLAGVLGRLIDANGASGGTYAEPYAGGAGAALSLLFEERVDRIVINDADRSIFAFWSSVLNETEAFVELIQTTPLSVEEWRRQREIYKSSQRQGRLTLGFATFYLNRCNRSGIIASAGPIGGLQQLGPWKIDARFNRAALISRVRRVAEYRSRIDLSNMDALEFLKGKVSTIPRSERPFAYLDPPYFVKGKELYMNHYGASDHEALATFVRERLDFPWLISYDDVSEIRRLYRQLRAVPLRLSYSARERRTGEEILILQPWFKFPREWRHGLTLGPPQAA